jgi:hypothetical protein
MESAGKTDAPWGNEKRTIPLSDPPSPPAFLKEFPQYDSNGKRVVSLEAEQRELPPRPPEGNNGTEERPVEESKDPGRPFQISREVEAELRNGQGDAVRKTAFSFGGAKQVPEGQGPQIIQEGEVPGGTPAQVLDPKVRESGVFFSGKAGAGQEKAFGAGAHLRPLADKEIQSPSSVLGTLTDPLNLKVENEGKIMEAPPSSSPKPETQSVFQQVGQGVLWLIRNDEERIRISLEPPELGQVFLEIDRHKEHVKTFLWTDNPTAKAALETSQAEVQKILESEGFKLERFSVFVQQDPGWFQGRKENPGKSDSWQARTSGEGRASPANPVESVPSRPPGPHPSSRYLDLLV